ncbi:MAG TPA: acyltransferase [Rhizobacter sp.]|nr:acyltransferase [Rhizobacter sp.]
MPAHLPSLDGVRGLAIALVFVHTLNVLDRSGDLLGTGVARLAGMGWVGVQLFFVLSGFLITRNLLELQGSPDYFRSFWGRRVLRIFPLYYATLIFFFVVWPLLGELPAQYAADVPHQWPLWLFLSNWTSWAGIGGMSLPHFWSLAVEEQFYLVWPFVVHRRTPRQLIAVCVALGLAAMAFRAWLLWAGFAPMQVYTFTVGRMDALAAGAAAAAWLHLPGVLPRVIAHRWRLLALAFGIGVLGKIIPQGYGMTDPAGQILGYSLLSVVFALLVVLVACSDAMTVGSSAAAWPRPLQWRVLRALGKYSFAMYVFQAPLKSLVGEPLLERLHWTPHPSTWQGVSYLLAMGVLALSMAWLSYHLLEKRFLRLKRFFVARKPAATPAALPNTAA